MNEFVGASNLPDDRPFVWHGGEAHFDRLVNEIREFKAKLVSIDGDPSGQVFIGSIEVPVSIAVGIKDAVRERLIQRIARSEKELKDIL